MDNTAMAIVASIMLTFGFMNGYIMAKLAETSRIAELNAKLDDMEDETEELNETIDELEHKIEEFEKTKEYVKNVLDGTVSLPPPPRAKRTETYGANEDEEDQTPTVTSP